MPTWNFGQVRLVKGSVGYGENHLGYCVGDVPKFLAEYWQKKPMLARDVSDEDFAAIVDREQIEVLLSGSMMRTDQIRVVQLGRRISREQYSHTGEIGRSAIHGAVHPGLLFGKFSEGATFVCDDVNKYVASVAEYTRGIAHYLGFPTQASLYITPPGHQGFDPHSDIDHVIVLQLWGSKHWKVEDETDGDIDIVLRTGDCLYIPAHTMHSAASTEEEMSAHVTIGVTVPTLLDIIGDFVRVRFAGIGLLREPRLGNSGADLVPQLIDAVAELGTLVDGVTRDEVAAFVAWQYARAGEHVGPVRFSDAEALGTVGALTLLRLKPHAVLRLRKVGADQVELRFGRKTLFVPTAVAEDLLEIDPAKFSVSQAVDAASRKSGDKIARLLVSEGVAELV